MGTVAGYAAGRLDEPTWLNNPFLRVGQGGIGGPRHARGIKVGESGIDGGYIEHHDQR